LQNIDVIGLPGVAMEKERKRKREPKIVPEDLSGEET